MRVAANKKLRKGVILFHGSPTAWDIPKGTFRGPGWFSTKLKAGIWYAGPLMGGAEDEREITDAMRPGVLVYEVVRPVPLYRIREPEDVQSTLYVLLVLRTKLLTSDEWSMVTSVGWNMDWSSSKWDSDEIRKHWGSDLADPLTEKMDRLGIHSVVGAIRAIHKKDPSFQGWVLDHEDGWEVMLCEPSKVLKQTDIWEVIEDNSPYDSDKSEENAGWRALTPRHRERPSPARVASRWLFRTGP